MLASKIFNTFSISLQLRGQYCYYIKQTYCIFFSHRGAGSAGKRLQLEMRCGPAAGELTMLLTPLVESHSLDAFGVSISASSAPNFSEPPNTF